MKRNAILLILLLFCFAMVFIGCTDDTNEKKTCVKCGGTATTTLSGTADTMQQYGIPIGNCKKITSNVYTANVCDS